ncbi:MULTISPECIES: glycine oxidase ThiO [unclassified Crossiella]|uniref:glycine oxidase ThiO n=1 Tax=unclassified Crossiella TaxID=2620835 RepID=UPI001FFE3B19|nr:MULTISPECIES: glycine oxidase ThiO [unclassified Crossiella]MCK2237896.1 glycine oxidase ThiO [Crossiella sp. S99.2]MCK2255182.1 glycine oxidase ThiO [Crossiella sp. S99.1]
MSKAVVVVGGGVIGLSIAWRAAAAGFRVRVVDPAPGSGSSWVAGGMLAPVTEAWPGEEDVLALGAASLRRWPEFAARLQAEAGRDPGLHTAGTLAVGVDAADRDELSRLAGYLTSLGREVHQLTGRELRRLEPALGPAVRGGLNVPGDLSVDNRLFLAALRAACAANGVEFIAVAAAETLPGKVLLDNGSILDSEVTVLAAGAWSARLYPGLAGLIRPVKGEILRLRHRRGALPPPARTVRGSVRGKPIYLVPRPDNGLVLGATQYEAGFDTDVVAGGVRDLLLHAEELMPSIAEYALVETAAGLRPGSMDNLPLLGWLEPGLLVAAGHHRNGVLLAPVTAEVVLDLLAGKEITPEAKAADPGRSR